MRTKGFTLRLATLATALVVGPATLAPGAAEAPVASGTAATATSATAALTGDRTTAAKRYKWRLLQWDFAWEFGESLDSGAYLGPDRRGGRWIEHSNGTGRAVKYGGGIEFHSGERYEGAPDRGTTTLTLADKPSRLGRWELRERFRLPETTGTGYQFVVELVPEGTLPDECPAYSLVLGSSVPRDGSVRIGVDIGNTAWNKTLSGYGRVEKEARLYGVQITGKAIVWFLDSRPVAKLAAPAAIPKVPLTLRMRLVGKEGVEMRKSDLLIDWVRHYDLTKGLRPATDGRLVRGTSPSC